LRQGRLQSARYLQHRLEPLATLLARENPAAVKYALCLLGFTHPDTRLPLVDLEASVKAEIAIAMAAIGEDGLSCEAWEANKNASHATSVQARAYNEVQGDIS